LQLVLAIMQTATESPEKEEEEEEEEVGEDDCA
jgi:hypothetical protein